MTWDDPDFHGEISLVETPLVEIPLGPPSVAPTPEIRELIAEGTRRIDEFFEEGLGPRYRSYVPSDPELLHGALTNPRLTDRLAGKVFCEWGSGFGLATGIASLLGWQAFGIEKEAELVERSLRLLEEFHLDATILETSFLPGGFEEAEGIGGKDLLLPGEGWGGVHESETIGIEGLDPEEVDLFFVYPWPDQEQLMMDLFRAVASEEAVLLMYLGDGEMVAYGFGEE